MSNAHGRVHGRRAALAVVALVALVLVGAACVPAAGRGTEQFVAAAEDVIGEIVAVGPNLQPGNQMNFYTVASLSDQSVTLVSSSTLGFALIFGQSQTQLSFSALQRGDVTVLASSGTGVNAEVDIERILSYLRSIFPAP